MDNTNIERLVYGCMRLANLVDTSQEMQNFVPQAMGLGYRTLVSDLREGCADVLMMQEELSKANIDNKFLNFDKKEMQDALNIVFDDNDLSLFTENELKQMHDAVIPLIKKWEDEYEE